MASLSISPPFKPSIIPSPTTRKPLKLPTLFFKPTPSRGNAIASSSHPSKPISHAGAAGSGLGLGFSPFSSDSQSPETAMRGAEVDLLGMLLRERIVFLGTQIDDTVSDAIISQLLLLDAQDHTKDIRLFIHSYGGSLSATMGIYDVLQLIRADVSTIGMGVAASTSSILLGGGTKGKRLAMPNTRIMIHQPFGGAGGSAKVVEIQSKELQQNKNDLIRIISGFTGRSFEQVEKDIEIDRYMSPIEAVEYGIIDDVIDRDAVIPPMPVPKEVKSKFLSGEFMEDSRKLLTPEVPDDEIY